MGVSSPSDLPCLPAFVRCRPFGPRGGRFGWLKAALYADEREIPPMFTSSDFSTPKLVRRPALQTVPQNLPFSSIGKSERLVPHSPRPVSPLASANSQSLAPPKPFYVSDELAATPAPRPEIGGAGAELKLWCSPGQDSNTRGRIACLVQPVKAQKTPGLHPAGGNW